MEEVRSIPLHLIAAGPWQPRSRFDADRLTELADSIRQQGVIQPIIVRRAGDRYQVIAGERRMRAAQLAGLTELPAIVRAYTDEQALEAALVENLQRQDLSVVEAARAFQRLAEEFHYSQAEIAHRTGKSRAAVSNTLRLLQLSAPVLDALDAGDLTEGHARALLGLPYPSLQAELAEWVVRNGMSVRDTEQKVRSLVAGPPDGPAAARGPVDAHAAALEQRLRERFGTRAAVNYARGRGSVVLEFYSDEDLCRIVELLGIEMT